jgi:hypothetical protein
MLQNAKLRRIKTSPRGCDILSNSHESFFHHRFLITTCHDEVSQHRVARFTKLQIKPDVGRTTQHDTSSHLNAKTSTPDMYNISRMRISPLLSRNGVYVAYPIINASLPWLQHLRARQIPNKQKIALISPPQLFAFAVAEPCALRQPLPGQMSV